MKHIFIVETADDVMLSPLEIRTLTGEVQDLVEIRASRIAFSTSICNQLSAVRAIYSLYGLDQSQSPDEIGCAK